MRRGTVVYLTGADRIGPDFDELDAVAALGLVPRLALIAAATEGFWDLEEASWQLVARGAKTIEAVWARPKDGGGLETFGPPCRIFG